MAIYLDYNATTPIDSRVADVMFPWLLEKFGNASSRDYALGWDAAEAVEEARASVAAVIGAKPGEVIFTSGATESLNAAIKGFVGYGDWTRKKIVTCATEHEAVLSPCLQLQKSMGIDVEILPVNSTGHLDLDLLENPSVLTVRYWLALWRPITKSVLFIRSSKSRKFLTNSEHCCYST
jgi:cysteine desulfurase